MPAILRWALQRRAAGAIVVASARSTETLATIHVREGSVVFASARIGPTGERAIESHVADIVTALFGVSEATARYEPSSIAFEGVVIPIRRLLVVGLLATPVEILERWAGDLDERIASTGDPKAFFADAALEPNQLALVDWVAAAPTVRAALEISGSQRGAVLALLLALRFGGIVRTVSSARPWIGDLDPFCDEGRATLSSFDPDEAARVCYEVEEKLRAVSSGADSYALLEVERRARLDAIKDRYRELAKRFHPDRHAALATFDPQLKGRLETVFGAIVRAYADLSSDEVRTSYDRALAAREQASAIRAPSPPLASRGRAVAEGESPGARSPRDAPLEAPAAVSPSAPVDGRGTHHPRPPAAPSTPAPTLSRPPVASPPIAWPRGVPQLDASKIFAFGLQCYANGDLARAILAFRKAIALAPASSAHHAALGRALLRAEGLTPQAESAMRAAITLDPRSADLLLEVGEVYLENGRTTDAKVLFTRASRLDPSNDEARLALAAMEGDRENLLTRLKRR